MPEHNEEQQNNKEKWNPSEPQKDRVKFLYAERADMKQKRDQTDSLR